MPRKCMRFGGYQPVTLLDYPETVAAIVFTQGCPFRCVYCHNPELIPMQSDDSLTQEDILSRIDADKGLIDGVCVTGGEPTVHPDLPEFLGQLKERGLKVKLDTNGMHPRMVRECLEKGLVDYLAMDIKQDFSRYTEIIGGQSKAAVANCEETMRLIQDSGVAHEFRTTVYPGAHTLKDLQTICSYLQPGESYALQPIRYQKTLQSDLSQDVQCDYNVVYRELQGANPHLRIILRS